MRAGGDKAIFRALLQEARPSYAPGKSMQLKGDQIVHDFMEMTPELRGRVINSMSLLQSIVSSSDDPIQISSGHSGKLRTDKEIAKSALGTMIESFGRRLPPENLATYGERIIQEMDSARDKIASINEEKIKTPEQKEQARKAEYRSWVDQTELLLKKIESGEALSSLGYSGAPGKLQKVLQQAAEMETQGSKDRMIQEAEANAAGAMAQSAADLARIDAKYARIAAKIMRNEPLTPDEEKSSFTEVFREELKKSQMRREDRSLGVTQKTTRREEEMLPPQSPGVKGARRVWPDQHPNATQKQAGMRKSI
jgi:hypothetical protein